MAARTRWLMAAFFAVPLVMAGLWLASGRERLTKSFKNVQEVHKDDLFDSDSAGSAVTRSVPGPIFGYYVGLDLVAGATLAAVGGAAGIWFWGRRRRAKAAPLKENP